MVNPIIKTADRRIKWMTQEQIISLFKASASRPVRDQLILALMYRFGLRTIEVISLPGHAIDLERKEITVTGAKRGLTRTYSLPPDLIPLMRKWERERDRSATTYFTGREGPLHRIRVWQIFKEAAKVAGLPKGFGPHSLRHSIIVHLLDAGLQLEDCKDLARHRRISSTEVYATISTTRRNNYLKRMDDSKAIVKLK